MESKIISVHQLKILFQAFIVFILFLLITVIFSPALLFRWILIKIQPYLRPDLYKILNQQSALFLLKGIEKEERSNGVFCLKIKGVLGQDEIMERISAVFLNSGTYPEFQMCTEYFMGYPFWKPEEHFRLEQHFTHEIIFGGKEVEFVKEFEYDFLKEAFKFGKSPWKIALLSGQENSYLIFKLHHSLSDAFAFFEACSKIYDNFEKKTTPTGNSKSDDEFFKVLRYYVTFPFKFAYDFAKAEKQFHPSPLDLELKEMSEELRIFAKTQESSLSCKAIKKCASRHAVSFSAVLMSGIIGGLQEYFRKNGVCPIPENISVAQPIPLPNHPGTLTNHFTGITTSIPFGTKDRYFRLQRSHQQLISLKKSTIPIGFHFFLTLIGSLPQFLLGKFNQTRFPPVQLNNSSGPEVGISIGGMQVVDMYVKMRLTKFGSLYFNVLSYNDGLQITANADPKIFQTEKELEDLVLQIQNELTLLIK